MRIIDADALLDKLKGTPRYFEVKHDIEEMPTVYDVEKVVAELEKSRHIDRSCGDVDYSIYESEAIEIVRKGGME